MVDKEERMPLRIAIPRVPQPRTVRVIGLVGGSEESEEESPLGTRRAVDILSSVGGR